MVIEGGSRAALGDYAGSRDLLRQAADLQRRVLEWLPSWEEEMSYGDVRGVAGGAAP